MDFVPVLSTYIYIYIFVINISQFLLEGCRGDISIRINVKSPISLVLWC